MPKTDLEKMRGSFKPYANGKTARQLLEEGRKEEYIKEKRLERMASKYFQKQRRQRKRKPA